MLFPKNSPFSKTSDQEEYEERVRDRTLDLTPRKDATDEERRLKEALNKEAENIAERLRQDDK